jgi:cell division initiation protein
MSISPAEVRHVRLGRRLLGYRRRDVDAALDRVAEAFAEVWRGRADVEERCHELGVELARHREIEEVLRRTLVSAERSADVMRADARRECDRIVREAEQRAREIVGEAHHERERISQDLARLEEREREFRARFRSLLHTSAALVDEHEREVEQVASGVA